MRSTENMKKLIKNLNLDVDTHSEADKRILGELLQAQEKSQKTEPAFTSPKIRRQKMSDRSRAWKVAAVIAVVMGAGALATTVGLKVRKLYFMGKEPDGAYVFATKPKTGDEPMRMVKSHHVDDVEQKIKDLEEVELRRQQDAGRELLSVVETEVNGKLQYRALRFKYILSDKREIKITEGDSDTKDREGDLTEAQEDEVKSLLRADEYVTIGSEKKEVRGHMFFFERNRFVLSDGTEVIKSIGRPIEDGQNTEATDDIDSKEAEQILNDKREIANLCKQDKRKLIGVDELTANGELDRRVFVYQYQLSDGRTKVLREGDELNFAINSEQRKEWVQLKDADSGENLGTYEEKVNDRVFVFKKQRFTLRDGTELIWSYGTLKDDQ